MRGCTYLHTASIWIVSSFRHLQKLLDEERGTMRRSASQMFKQIGQGHVLNSIVRHKFRPRIEAVIHPWRVQEFIRLACIFSSKIPLWYRMRAQPPPRFLVRCRMNAARRSHWEPHLCRKFASPDSSTEHVIERKPVFVSSSFDARDTRADAPAKYIVTRTTKTQRIIVLLRTKRRLKWNVLSADKKSATSITRLSSQSGP